MRELIKRGAMSFALSAFSGIIVNLIIDLIANLSGSTGFHSMSPDYVALFPTPVIAAYVNVLLYGLIGMTFAVASFIYEVERIGFIVQSIIYFVITSAVCVGITMILWQLHKYPIAFICTLCGYAATHVILITIEYRKLKADIAKINELSDIVGE